MTIQEYNDIYKNSITKSMQIESSGGVTITNTNICSEQMSLEESLCSEENLIIGSCESACFKIRIADMNHNFEGETLTVYQMIMVDAGGDLLLESGDSDYILLENGDRISLEMVGVPVPYGKFKVLSDKPTNDRRWRDLTCYDAMYDILNADVAEWYNSLTFPMTIKDFRDRFFNYLGITQDTVTLVNDNFETQGGFSVSGSLSGKDVITSICELNGVFGHISRDGLFEYISLPSADSLALDWYIDGTGAYEDYLVQKITGIVARSSEDDVGTTVGTDTNVYVVEDNPLIYGSEGTASLTTALTNLLNNVKDINYRPFNVDTYGNPMLPLGTNLTITTRNQTINSFLMTRVLSGIQSLKDSISAKGEKYRPTEVNSLRSETKRTKGIIHELINDVDELRSTITDLDNQTSSEIQQLSDEIVLKVDASGNIVKVALASNASEGSTFAVNADNIRFTAGSVMRFDANNIIINSTYFKVDQYGNLESTSGKIGGWYIRSGGLSNGMTTVTDFANTGIFLSSGGRIVINDANTHTNSRIDKDSYSIIRNDIGANAYVGYISNSVGFGFTDAYGSQVSFKGTALNLGCVKDGTSVISNVRLQADPFSITLYGGDTGYANKIISLIQGFRDNSWTNEKVTYVDTYKGLQTCDTTKTEVEYVHGVTSNIQTQLNGKQATITGGATTIVSDNLTASKALVSNANGKVAVSNVTDTELGYLSRATSNIQGQIDDATTITTKTDNEPYLKRSGVAIGDREYLDKLIGGTIAWNQYVQNGNFTSLTGWKTQQGNLSVSNNVLTNTLSGASWNQDVMTKDWSITFKVNHKYLYTFGLQCTSGINGQALSIYIGGSWAYQWGMSTTRTVIRHLYTPSSDRSFTRLVFSGNASPYAGEKYMIDNFMVFDLTQMFGSAIADYIYSLGDEGSVEYLQSYGFLTKDYYPYSTGELVSTKPSAHKMTLLGSIIGNYPFANVELRGNIVLQNNELVFNGDEYASDGTVTRVAWIVNGLSGLTRSSAKSFWFPPPYKGKNGGWTLHTLSDLVTSTAIDWQGNIFINTVNEYDSWQTAKAALQNIVIVYQLGTPRTETVAPYTNPQICERRCYEEFVDTRDVPMPAGHSTEYIDIPSWMVNRYFNDLRELPYEVDTITKKANIYGAEWDGTANSKWTRTDSSRYFPEPHPAINNGNGFSPFDNLYPWAGMVVIEDADAGTLVSIPKFWYKWTRDGAKMKLQIADAPIDGFLVSPAHADRGDGKGERDVVYVGAYHCAVLTYKSTTDVAVQRNETRASFRTNIHNLGSNIWQWDYAMLWTIRMLYLVEYADWNSQEKIGYGCGNNTAPQSNGFTDSMIYHTGTNVATRQTYGHVKYRGIEGLWDNVYDWCDGIYFSGSTIYAIKNPADFSDSTGGVNVGTRPALNGVIKTWTQPSISGLEYFIYPSTVTTDNNFTTYSCDACYYINTGTIIHIGGGYEQGQVFGLFSSFCTDTNSSAYGIVGSRLMKLP